MNDPHMDAAGHATIAEQAAHYWVALHAEDAGEQIRRTFAEWTARSPQHVAAYLRLARAVRAVRQPEVHWPQDSAETLIREAKAERAEVIQLRRGPARFGREVVREREEEPALKDREEDVIRAEAPAPRASRQSRHPWALPALAASALLTIGVAVTAWQMASPDRYTTRVGELRSVALEDGTIATLNTSSEIQVTFTGKQRNVRLIEGEALFQVAHDPRRPFDVTDGSTTVRAVGTEFNVDRRQDHTTVTVLEGRVAVITPPQATAMPADSEPNRTLAGATMLGATEQLVIANGHVGAPKHVASVAPAVAWTRRQLIFNRQPIADVAREFNRYNRLQIEVHDSQLAQEPLTGVFQANDPQSFLTFLAHMQGVSIDTAGTGNVVVNKR